MNYYNQKPITYIWHDGYTDQALHGPKLNKQAHRWSHENPRMPEGNLIMFQLDEDENCYVQRKMKQSERRNCKKLRRAGAILDPV